MTFDSILLLAVGLAADAAAVSATRGMAVPALRVRHVLLVAGFFGGFQMLMPCVGWLLGASVGPRVARWDHWIAFALLTAIGAKTLWEAFAGDHAAAPGGAGNDAFRPRLMFGLAIATSIDALAAGITLPMLDAPFWLTVATIDAITASLCAVGLFAGRRFGELLGRRLDAAGGLVLIALAVKILLEHTL